MPVVPNVILFGETGAGKSSIINLIAQRNIAAVSSGARGCTFESARYHVNILGSPINIYDTVGLNEGDAGQIPKQEAIVQLYKLISSLDTGVSLLVFCMRGPRIKDAAHKNYRLFHEIFCRKQVPIVIVITGLEQEPVMDDWWYRNKGAFQKYEMLPSGFACITATRGKQLKSGAHMLDAEYEESKQKVWRVIKSTHLVSPWKMKKVDWFSYIVNITYESRMCRKPKEHRDVKQVVGPGIKELVRRCEMSEQEAKQLAQKLV